jgi:hypothetical protein
LLSLFLRQFPGIILRVTESIQVRVHQEAVSGHPRPMLLNQSTLIAQRLMIEERVFETLAFYSNLLAQRKAVNIPLKYNANRIHVLKILIN